MLSVCRFTELSLREIINTEKISLETTLAISVSIIDKLLEFQNRGIVNYKLYPENIIVTNKEDKFSVRFINKSFDSSYIQYMSPEETGLLNAKCDFKKDFYTLGIIFYEIITRNSLIKGEDCLEIIYMHLTKEFKEPKNREIPKVVWEIIKKLLNKNPEERYMTYFGLKADLEKCLYQLQHLGFINNFALGQKDIASNIINQKKFYGKKFLKEKVGNIYKKIDEETNSILVIKGEQGSGKTSIIKELKKQLNTNKDYYISISLKKKQNMIPYFFMMNEFKDLIDRILMEDDESIASWRYRFINALGANVDIISEHIPEFKLILGKDYEVKNINNAHLFNDFADICEKIIEIFTENNHVFMLILDDVQWIEKESFDFIKRLLKCKIKKFFLVCTWTDKDKNAEKFSRFKEELKSLDIIIETMDMEPLTNDEIKGILMEGYSNSLNRCDELSTIIKVKTHGNLYFVNKFIKEINENNLIEYNYEKNYWEWNTEQVSLISGKDGIFDSMDRVILDLPEEVKDFLKIACCFREKFTIYLMTKLCERTTSEMVKVIAYCINKDLILELEPGEYVLSSRKITEIVNELLNDEEKKLNIARIARSLGEEHNRWDSKINVFDVLYYYNQIRDLIKDENEVLYLIKLNYEGGLSAYNSFAYNEAANYLGIAISFINTEFWLDHYELAYGIYIHSIDCFYSSSHFDEGDYYSEILLQKSKSRMDKCRIYNIRIKQYTRWNKIEPAISMAYRAINIMESGSMAKYYLNKKRSKEEFKKLIKLLKEKDINEFANLTENTNIDKRILMTIYNTLWILGYISCREELCFIAALRMFKISVYYGNMADSAFGYACFASTLMDAGEYDLGKEFGNLSLKLVERSDNVQLNSGVKFVYGDKVTFFTEKLNTWGDVMEDAYKAAIKCGNLTYASNSGVSMIYQKFISGEQLEKMQVIIDRVLNTVEHSNNGATIFLIQLRQCILKFMDENQEYKEVDFPKDDNNGRLKFYYYSTRVLCSYIMEEYDQAIDMMANIKDCFKSFNNIPLKLISNYIYALILMGVYEKCSKEDKLKYKKKMNQVFKDIEKNNVSNNKGALYMLVEAEKAKINGKDMKAMNLYEVAIQQAENDEDNHLCAICNERAFKYYISRNINKIAVLHFNDCIRFYEYWGVKVKVDKLKNEYGEMLYYNKVSHFDIDLNALFKSAQIISNEMEYDMLLKKLIKITMERAGAERCCLIMDKGGRLNVVADTKSENMDIEIFEKEIPLENYIPLLKTVIYYVSRCKETIVIEDAKKSEFYYGEKYIHENHVKSVLCIPICYNSKIKAILYFENNLITGAFNKNAIETLKLLTSQTAASIENAMMYNSIKEMNEKLESTVKERTKELEVTVKMLMEEAEERKAVKEALLQSESRLRTLINNTSDYITFMDAEGRYVEINAAAVQLLGLQGINYRNKTIMELSELSDGNKETFLKINSMDKVVMNKKREVRFNQILLNSQGEENYYDIISTPVYNNDGETAALVVVARNITEREKAEELQRMYTENARKLEEVMEYDKMRTEFIANISHELRTPLNVILSSHQMCSLLLGSMKCSGINEKISKYMGMTKQNCYRLLRLINNLIDITKIDSGYLNPEFVMGDIVNFIEGITLSVVTFAESRGITIIFDTQVEEKYIPFDQDKIERIMLNLLSNAIKFTPANGYIYVNINDFFDRISISVKDTGIGIPKEKKMEIFNRFVQLDKSFTRENEGSGIGLALVKSLVDMHQGDIAVKSEFGEGSEFIVTIPAFLDEDIIIKEEKIFKDDSEEKIERVKIEFSDIYI